MDYSITNEKGQWITGDITTGRYVWTASKEHRYTLPFDKACEIAERVDGFVLREA